MRWRTEGHPVMARGDRASTHPGTVTVRHALAQSGLAPIDAQALLAHVLGRNRAWLVAHADAALSSDDAASFAALAKRRRDGEPVAYLTGIREFWGMPLVVSPAVLIPRPETETLVELALARLPVDRATRVLDLGTGSGAIALAIAQSRPLAQVLATDASAAALAVARENAGRLGIRNVELLRSDWYEAVPPSTEGHAGVPFDLIVANPPYVVAGDPHLDAGDLRFEPVIALTPGGDGLDALRTIVAGAPCRLAAGGTLAVEHGYDQSEAVQALFAAAGFAHIVAVSDIAGIPRVVAGEVGAGA
jgi:release factor glutamine methyltransferase